MRFLLRAILQGGAVLTFALFALLLHRALWFLMRSQSRRTDANGISFEPVMGFGERMRRPLFLTRDSDESSRRR